MLLGAFIMLVSYAGFLAAAPPASSEEKGIPGYLESEFTIIKEMLELNADKLDALNAQLAGVETELKAEIVLAKKEINANMDLLAGDVVLLAEEVEKALVILRAPDKDIQLTTEVCFDLGASWDWAYSSKLVGGLGIELGVKGEASLELGMPGLLPLGIPPFAPWAPIVPAVSAGISDTICVTIPLYAVASNDHWYKDFNTEQFDDLIATIAQPAQFLLPGLAYAYGEVMPTPEEAVDFVTSGLAVFDTSSSTSSKTNPLSNRLQSDKTVLLSNGMRVNQEALYTLASSHDDLMSSPLLRNITQSDSIGEAMNDPCALAASFDLPSADALAAQCGTAIEMFWDVVDPFCLLDLIIDHCPGPF